MRYSLPLIIAIMLSATGCQHAATQKSGDAKEAPVTQLSLAQTARVEESRTKWGDHYAQRMDVFLRENSRVPLGGTVFLGDSITERFPLRDIYPDQIVVNRGIGGDRVDGLRDRLDVSVSDLEPKRIYLMIGCNDVTYPVLDAKQFGAHYAMLLDAIYRQAPEAKLTVLSILPYGPRFEKYNALGTPDHPGVTASQLNNVIAELAAKRNLPFVDLTPWMSDEKGLLRASYTIDDIHLSLDGYVAWLEAITPAEDFYPVARHVAPLWAKSHGLSFPITHVDPPFEGKYPGSRGPDELIVYTPAYGHPKTGTNAFGAEAIVRGGAVTERTVGDTEIPADGYIASGHGNAASWLKMNLNPGVKVQQTDSELRVEPAAVPAAGADRMAALRSRFFLALAKAGGEQEDEFRLLARALRTLDSPTSKRSPETLDAFEKTLSVAEGSRGPRRSQPVWQ
ncbi:hypothetical protein BH09SUM1_BH09SUM1_23510 [soil metagenome]